MKSMTLKMFLSYWVIMIGVNIASDFVAPEQMRRYSLIREAIRSAMLILAQQELDAYEAHGRGDGTQYALASGDALYIANTNGRMLCTDTGLPGLDSLAARMRGSKSVMGHRFDSFQVVATATKGRSGREYVLFLKSPISPR